VRQGERRRDAGIVGLHHAQITVPKGAEDEARRFYCGVLGLAEVEKPASLRDRGGLWVWAGDRQVHIGTEDGVDRTATKAHLAYEVADVTWWRRHLESRGIRPLDSVPIEGYDRFEARDPFDNRIEFIQRRTAERDARDVTERH
jgi:catechol 2,3-dioxygenase-like lactoylglutathione lyase family enzyme